MKKERGARFLHDAKKYIEKMSKNEQGALARNIESLLKSETNVIHIKHLQGQVYELIVKHHRITYFALDQTIYFVRGFHKKANKTPKNEIDYAQKIYKIFKLQ